MRQGEIYTRRLRELPERFGHGKDLKGFLRGVGLSKNQFDRHCISKRQRLGTARRIADALDLIPVVLYNPDDRDAEYLGVEGFLDGVRVKNYIGEVLRVRREEKGMRPVDVSDKSGLQSSSIGVYEKGVSLPSAGSLEAICHALGLVPDFFVTKDSTYHEAQFRGAVDFLERASLSPNRIHPEDLEDALRYAKRVAQLYEQLRSD